ncbi:hypothetical protein [Bacillus cereus]
MLTIISMEHIEQLFYSIKTLFIFRKNSLLEDGVEHVCVENRD